MLDVDVGLYSARKTICLCYVQDTFVSTTPFGVMARGSSGPVTGSPPGLVSTLVRSSRSGSFPKPAAGATRLR